MDERKISQRMSYLLRHNPEDLSMDKRGWVKTEELLKKLEITQEELDNIVTTNSKKRFGYSNDKSLIRAHQGHSAKLNLRVEFKEVQFPINYYHGTNKRIAATILREGLKPMKRSYVHLSKSMMIATTVGRRHGNEVVIFIIDGNQMKRDGYKIYESENDVILVDSVPPKYLKLLEEII